MSRSTALVDRDMRTKGYVSAAVTCAQYGITRSQLVDFILQGKIKSQKPESGAGFYILWTDIKALLGTPAEHRANPRRALEPELEPDEPEILLDGMLPTEELDSIYRKEATLRAANKAKAATATAASKQANRIVVRPQSDSDFDDDLSNDSEPAL